VAQRLLHEPTIRLRGLDGERSHASLELVRELFGLHEETPAGHAGEELAEVHPIKRAEGRRSRRGRRT
jgi:glutamyl-tRNA reductase